MTMEFVSGKLETENLNNTLFLVPNEFVTFLKESEAQAAGTVETVRDYKVRCSIR